MANSLGWGSGPLRFSFILLFKRFSPDISGLHNVPNESGIVCPVYRDGHAAQTYMYSAPYKLRRISLYWPFLQTLINRRILGRTPYTPYTTYIREQLKLGVYNIVALHAQPIASCAQSPCQALKIYGSTPVASCQLEYFDGPDVVPLIVRATTKFAVTQPRRSEKVRMAHITERRNLWNWLPALPNLAVIANQFLSMHTTQRVRQSALVEAGPDICQESRKARH